MADDTGSPPPGVKCDFCANAAAAVAGEANGLLVCDTHAAELDAHDQLDRWLGEVAARKRAAETDEEASRG